MSDDKDGKWEGWEERKGEDRKGLERIGKDWKGLERKGKERREKWESILLENPSRVNNRTE